MKLNNLDIYELEEDGELKHIGGQTKIDIVDKHYMVGNEPQQHLIEEYEHLTHTDYTKTKVEWPYAYRIRKDSNNGCELCIKLDKFQALKYRLMFVSGKSLLERTAEIIPIVVKFVIGLVG